MINACELDALRPQLLRFAQLQLRNAAVAEDAVSETMLAVLEHPERFVGQSSLKTYIVGILKHKIIDTLRAGKREVQLAANDDDDSRSDAELVDALFAADGHYHEGQRPTAWGDPQASLERREFFEVLQICIDKLPTKTARIFMMREWLELETDEICSELGVTTANAWVLLYRARMRLRDCLQLNWFGGLAAPR